MRIFIAITFSDFIRKTLFQCAQGARARLDVEGKLGWVNPQNYHMTLYFLGEVSGEVLHRIGSPLRQSVGEFSPFIIEFEKIDLFPSIEKPHALVVSIKPKDDLIKLRQQVVSVVSSIGEKVNDPRSFLPHVTLARVKEAPVLPLRSLPISLSFEVQEVQLLLSRLIQNEVSYQPLLQIQLSSG